MKKSKFEKQEEVVDLLKVIRMSSVSTLSADEYEIMFSCFSRKQIIKALVAFMMERRELRKRYGKSGISE